MQDLFVDKAYILSIIVDYCSSFTSNALFKYYGSINKTSL